MADEYIVDLIMYLEALMLHLTHVPDAVREAVHFTSCKHISSYLLGVVQGAGVKRFNMAALYNLRLDVQEIVAFAVRCSILNLPEVFAEIQQLLALFLDDDLAAMLDPVQRRAQYPQVSLEQLCSLLEKYKEVGVFSSAPSGLPKTKKKDCDAVAKQLKKILKKEQMAR